VTDAAALLAPDERAGLEARLQAAAALGELVVVTLAAPAPNSPAEHAFSLFDVWGVGGATGNGALLLLATAERRIEIMVGTAWEPRLPPAALAEALGGRAAPLLAEERWSAGLWAAVDGLLTSAAEHAPRNPLLSEEGLGVVRHPPFLNQVGRGSVHSVGPSRPAPPPAPPRRGGES
jgi:uncharacterized membrane protein YgcG